MLSEKLHNLADGLKDADDRGILAEIIDTALTVLHAFAAEARELELNQVPPAARLTDDELPANVTRLKGAAA